MTTLQELDFYLEELLQSSAIIDYCPNGIQVEGNTEIQRIATGVSASLATIQAAAACQAQALIVHHGLFWNRDSYVISGVKREKLRLLFEHQISLLAYHLPLDAHQQLGNNWKAASDMGWSELQPFCQMNGSFIGVKGVIPPQTREDFQKSLEEYYLHQAHCAFGGKETVRTAALISGGAYKSIRDAASVGVDCFITGNYDEPAWHDAHEEKINFYALGHSATERIGPQALGTHLSEKFDLDHHFLDILNPF